MPLALLAFFNLAIEPLIGGLIQIILTDFSLFKATAIEPLIGGLILRQCGKVCKEVNTIEPLIGGLILIEMF